MLIFMETLCWDTGDVGKDIQYLWYLKQGQEIITDKKSSCN